jgi:NADPH-dependent glutamate synthase beta subunit-like oxidoreductase
MKAFEHIDAATLEDAAAALGQPAAQIIAGGTDLLGLLKDDVLPTYPGTLVNVKTIPGLEYIEESEGLLKIGAVTRLADIAANPTVAARYTALAQAAAAVGSPQIREMGTIAGNLCQLPRCWYLRLAENRFNCLRKGGRDCPALTGDSRYHSIFGGVRVGRTACMQACPNGVDIPGYMSKVRAGDMRGAAEMVFERNPLPAITGRVCAHFCENDCARGEYDQAVSVREVERALGDYVLENASDYYRPPATASGKRVAVIGSGPAGLSAAHYLRAAGHDVTVLEKMPEAGGLLRYGIPPYRLPRQVLAKQLAAIEAEGVQFVLGTEVTKDGFAQLRQRFDAVFTATGAWQAGSTGIAGEEWLGSATAFLREANLGDPAALETAQMAGKEVLIVGGGNTAIDVARSLVRLGAHPTVMYRRTRAEMPAVEEEVAKAEQEGVRFEFLAAPLAAAPAEEGVGLTCCRMELGDLDESGRPRPVKLEGSEFAVCCDAVMTAVAERPDYSFLPAEFLDEEGRLKLDEGRPGTAGGAHALADDVFVGGDFVTGPATVGEAVGAGREAARRINERLLGAKAASAVEGASGGAACAAGRDVNPACISGSCRAEVPQLSLDERTASPTKEETGTLDRSSTEAEAARCFDCCCVAVNSSDLAPVLIALGARIKTTSRLVEAESFFEVNGEKTTVLDDDEIVIEIQIPVPAPGARSAFSKYALRKSIDFPIVSCAVAIDGAGAASTARICLNAVHPLPYRALAAERMVAGKSIDEGLAEAAGEAAVADAQALEPNRYKVQIAKTMVKRAILACR